MLQSIKFLIHDLQHGANIIRLIRKKHIDFFFNTGHILLELFCSYVNIIKPLLYRVQASNKRFKFLAKLFIKQSSDLFDDIIHPISRS